MATGTIRNAELAGLDNERCPQCGGKDHTRWIDSDRESDTWECAACGYEWAILVTELTRSPQQP